MQISMWVAYDEKRLRRTLQFLIRPRLRRVRIAGGLLIACGLALIVLDPLQPIAYLFLLLGVVFAVAVGPIAIAKSMRLQSNAIKDGLHMTLDDEWVTVTFPLAESRFRWAGLDRVVETPECWYAMFTKVQAITIPKDSMTEQQRAEFAAFLANRQLVSR